MTTLPPLHPQPSWTRPIVLGASFAVFAQLLPLLLAGVLPPTASCATPCCCALEILPIGILPAWLARRQDPMLTPSQGFSVSFIAVGLGSFVVALVMFLQIRTVNTEELRRVLIEQMNTMQAPGGPKLSEQDRAAAADTIIEMYPYVPAILATVVTVLGGFVGMIATAMGKRSHLAPPPPPPPPLPPMG